MVSKVTGNEETKAGWPLSKLVQLLINLISEIQGWHQNMKGEEQLSEALWGPCRKNPMRIIHLKFIERNYVVIKWCLKKFQLWKQPSKQVLTKNWVEILGVHFQGLIYDTASSNKELRALRVKHPIINQELGSPWYSKMQLNHIRNKIKLN